MTKSIVIPALLAVVLAGVGFLFWTMGHHEQRLAEAHRQLATLQYAEAAGETDEEGAVASFAERLSGNLGRDAATDARELRATADYWQHSYASLVPQRDAGGTVTETDPEVLMVEANASFRSAQTDTDRVGAMRKLDTVVKNYAEVLKTKADDVDAAFNYEYAVRVRDSLARARALAAKPPAQRVAADDSDLPGGPTLHGRPGGPPPQTSMAQFKIVIPKRGEERKDSPEAGKGGTKIRKG
jgi:hypothetical protein